MSFLTPAFLAIFKMELLMLIRDRRTVMLSVVLPALFMPLMMFGGHLMQQRTERELSNASYRFAIMGSQEAAARKWIQAIQPDGAGKRGSFRFRENPVDEPLKALEGGDLDFVLEAEIAKGKDLLSEEKAVPGLPVLKVIYRADNQRSAHARVRALEALREVRSVERLEMLGKAGFPVSVQDEVPVEMMDLASNSQVAGLALGRLATLLLLTFVMMGGSVVAMDTLAGERERGTLETLLCTAVGTRDIIAAKFAAVLGVSLVITLIHVLNFLLYAVFRIIPTSLDLAAVLSPGLALILLLFFIPLAVLASVAMLLVSGRARSHKEAQIYFFPLFLVMMAPTLTAFLPGISLRSAIAIVPIANVAVAAKEALTGRFDWPMLSLAFLSSSAAAVWLLRHAMHSLSIECLLAAGEAEEHVLLGPLRFRQRVIWVFAAMWGLTFLLSSYYPKGADIRLQLFVNLVLIFGGATWFMLRHYRLDVREALSLRMPHPLVWPAVLLGAPAALLVAQGLARLVNLFIPVPKEILEHFSQALLPQGISMLQMLLMMSVLPGVMEELAFRGALLHGLSGLRPWARCLTVGIIFGLFHFALFRLFTTAFLGTLLAFVTLWSGSIYPAILWHALNNAMGILLAYHRIDLDTMSGMVRHPALISLLAAALLAGVFRMLWLMRRWTV